MIAFMDEAGALMYYMPVIDREKSQSVQYRSTSSIAKVLIYASDGYAHSEGDTAQAKNVVIKTGNIRPIHGRTEVKVERCGENLFDITQCRTATLGAAYGLTVTTDNTGLIRVFGTPNVTKDIQNASFRILFTSQVIFSKKYKAKWFVVKGVVLNVSTVTNDTSIVLNSPLSPNTPVDIQFRLMYYTGDEPTTYSPYIGSTNTLTLPSTVYGGEVNENGAGQETWKMITLTGTENWGKYGSVNEQATASCFSLYIDDKQSGFATSVCNQFVNTKNSDPFLNTMMKEFTYTDHPNISAIYMDYGDDQTITEEEWKAFLAAQHAAGTPVQIAYKLAVPIPFAATGGAAIPALSGTNTVLTDADDMTVTGRADPIQTISKLSKRIAALEAAATNIDE